MELKNNQKSKVFFFRFFSSYSNSIVANPRNVINPSTSVNVTINTPLARAGSIPRRLSRKGIETPAMDEARILINIDAPTISPIFHVVLKNKTAKTETITDQKTPFTKATRNSLDNNLNAFAD